MLLFDHEKALKISKVPPSLSVTLCLVPVSMKPLLLKSTVCSDWSAGAVCCDWCLGNVPPLTITASFNTLPTNSTRTRPFILRMNYLNKEYCEENSRLQWRRFREFRNTDTDIEKNSCWRDFGNFQSFFMIKQQHYTLKKDEHGEKKGIIGPL